MGPLSGFFATTRGGLHSPAFILGRNAGSSFKHDVEIDSIGVKYRRRSRGTGQGSGLTIGMPLDDHLRLTYDRDAAALWKRTLRRDFRASSRGIGTRSKSRLEWTVPFPRSSGHLGRFLGRAEPTLKIHGQIKTTLGGRSQWTDGEVRTSISQPSKFPALSLDQEQQFTVEGKVGELINIRITQDTQQVGTGFGSVQDQLANQIKLDYKGEEDAIFQEVQAGNTTLSLPGTKFVGFRQQHKGLFGIRAKGRLGPLGFTTIASHEKSQGNRKTFRGGATADTTEKRDYEYVQRKYFFLDEFYRDNLPDYSRLALSSQIRAEDFVDDISLEVYINDFSTRSDAELLAKEGIASVDVEGPVVEESGFVERGTWHRLDPDDGYTLVSGAGFIILERSVSDREALAVSYRTADGRQFGDTRGDTLKLKLLKAQDSRPTFPTWDLEWRNVYQIVSSFSRGKKFESDAVEVQILKEIPGREPEASQDGKSFLEIFGLDEHGQDPGSPSDRRVDADYIGLDEFRGYLILPDLTPFNPQHPKFKAALKDTVPEAYNTHQQRDKVEASKYIIQTITRSTQQRISLGFGVNPTSVEVILNGERLKPKTDYNVSFTGDVTFTSSVARQVATPGADLEINFESEELFGIGGQQKTLLGLRTEYEFWEGDGTLGSTVIYNNERTSNRRVRVGGEPARTVLWDMDVKARFKAPLLTRFVDAMPLIKTATPSAINLQAEVAQSKPNLNTQGVGYIDDFEGSERFTGFAVQRVRWTESSVPEDPLLGEDNRGGVIWYNPVGRVLRTDIWPGQEQQVEAGTDQTDVLTIELTQVPGVTQSWGGIMNALPTITDLSQAKFLEVWAQGTEGELHIDIGTISEDINDDGKLDTEDIPIGGLSTGDGQVSSEEDTGLDGRDLEAELDHFLVLAGADTLGLTLEQKQAEYQRAYPLGDSEDPQGDDFFYDIANNEDDYSGINGTEGNRDARGAGALPDSEDLNNDGVLEGSNDYYQHTIDLAIDPHIPGTEHNGWRLFRLPLFAESVERIGSPDSSRVEFARLTLASGNATESPVLVRIALMEIIENRWQEDDIRVLDDDAFAVGLDEIVNVTVVGTDKNTEYVPPPRVKRRRNVGSRTFEREQSLVLEYEELQPGHQVSATRVLSRRDNYTKYTRLMMFVHGDSLDTYVVSPDSSDLELFLRFGADSTNYYEVVSQLFPGWDNFREDWRGNEVEVDLLEMAFLKGRLQNAPADSTGRFPTVLDSIVVDEDLRDGEPALYRVRGNPSMQQIRQLTIGLRNRSDKEAYTGRVYVDELRLDAARNDPGLAAYFKVNTNLADLMNVDSEVTWQEEDFRTLKSTGRNSSDLKTALNTKTQLDRLLPGRWAVDLPLRANYSRSKSLPRFGPNSDVELTASEKTEQRTVKNRTFYELQMNKRAGQNWLLRWTIDQMKMGLSYSEDVAFSPTQPVNNAGARAMNFSYSMPLPKPFLAPMRWTEGIMPTGFHKLRFYYLPSTLSYSMRANRKTSETLRRADSDTTFHKTFTMKETYTAKVAPFSGLSADYNLAVDRDLRKKYELQAFSFGREVKRVQKVDSKLRFSLVRWLDQNYTFQATYNELNDPTRRTAQVVIDTLTGSPLKTRDITTKNSLSAKYNFKLPVLLKGIGGGDKGGPDRFVLWRLVNFAGRYTDPVNATFRRDTDAKNFNLVERPPFNYQIGLEDTLLVRRVSAGLTKQDQWSRINQVDVSSGLKLPMGFSIKPSFNRKLTRRSGSTQTRRRVQEDRVFPKTTINWSKADRLPLIRSLINSSQVSASYQTTQTSQGEGNLDPGNLISRGKSTEVRTSWNGRVRIGPTLSIERSRSTSLDLDFELANPSDTTSFVAPPLRGSSSNEKVSTTFKTSYNLKPRGLPLFGKLKSNIDLRYTFSIENTIRSSATSDAEREPISDTNKWKSELRATYKFSSSFRGEGLIRLENNRNNLTEKTRKLRELRVTGTLFFR